VIKALVILYIKPNSSHRVAQKTETSIFNSIDLGFASQTLRDWSLWSAINLKSSEGVKVDPSNPPKNHRLL